MAGRRAAKSLQALCAASGCCSLSIDYSKLSPKLVARSCSRAHCAKISREDQAKLAACKTLASKTRRACSCLSILQFANGPKRSMEHFLGGKKMYFFNSRPTTPCSMAAAPVKSCRSLLKRSPWGRLGSVLYTCKRLHRVRRRFQHFWSISLSRSQRNSNF